ncbi:hypothetical protein [Rhizobium lentis]|uniref:hypothetical protein n=1 Tax=Rhizobium lentis TaxID=1138194 RepID=UPI001A91D267|nr:hypothetical protein [Rhizobium lentis]MBX4998855.1 hypothetical protein [Rhizobium lentis]MBX5017764.1 hypothetical protein [Rhizobium lentis]MBX5069090.1 hypothetical protein [Rhizobium lentis]MBX5080133.1 hypothetical protein [Rhizobium lentis]QSW95996.1 hypothetical protein J0663_24785 [Rhizobium lentis]
MTVTRNLLQAALAASASFSVPAFSQAASAPHLPIVRGDTNLQRHGEYVDQMIADFATGHGPPGISMAIVQAPYIPWSAGCGGKITSPALSVTSLNPGSPSPLMAI